MCIFFSSRRRHTRSKRDWSSDVCSSDLSVEAGLGDPQKFRQLCLGQGQALPQCTQPFADFFQCNRLLRSEERRVGKEGKLYLKAYRKRVKECRNKVSGERHGMKRA